MEFKESIEHKRYYTIDNTGKTDNYMKAWIDLKTARAMGVNAFRQQTPDQIFNAFLEDFDLAGYADRPLEEQEVLKDQWQDFAKKYVSMCRFDKSYSTALFGLITLKNDAIRSKITEEVDGLLASYADQFGHRQDFAPLYDALKAEIDEALPL